MRHTHAMPLELDADLPTTMQKLETLYDCPACARRGQRDRIRAAWRSLTEPESERLRRQITRQWSRAQLIHKAALDEDRALTPREARRVERAANRMLVLTGRLERENHTDVDQ